MFEVDGCFSASMTHLIICYTQLSTEHNNGIVFPTCVYLFLEQVEFKHKQRIYFTFCALTSGVKFVNT